MEQVCNNVTRVAASRGIQADAYVLQASVVVRLGLRWLATQVVWCEHVHAGIACLCVHSAHEIVATSSAGEEHQYTHQGAAERAGRHLLVLLVLLVLLGCAATPLRRP
jgi:hypothetical protein